MRKIKRMIYLFILLLAIILLYLQLPLFGSNPKGERLSRIEKSPNYKSGSFQNLETTIDDVGIIDGLRDMIFNSDKDATPKDLIPSIKINLNNLDNSIDKLVWLGHSSYFLQVDGVKILVDPILSKNASPVPFSTRAFKGTDSITVNDIPTLDYLILTHDHYDHLDYETIKKLKKKVKHVITPLGVGAHLEGWGYSGDIINELDWNDSLELNNGLKITSTTARHGSGRKFKRDNTLWSSFVLETSSQKLFIGGDSGYGKHFKDIGEKYGPFDLVILENGQYNKKWPKIHLFPEQVLQASKDLRAKRLFPVHSGKFKLASHAWYEPLREVVRINDTQENKINLLTPIIGEEIDLKDTTYENKYWFLNIN